jgi:hypothetical protein
MLEWLLVWAVFGGLIGAWIHQRKGHSPVTGLIGGLMLGPVLVWLMWLVSAAKKCPACAELVQPDAKVCKHCGHQIAQVAA